MGFMKKEYFYYGFILILFIFIGIFCFQIFFDRTLIENIGIYSQGNLCDYFADFINQVRITYDEKIYAGEEWKLGEKALPPFQYLLLIPISKCCDFNQFSTMFLNGDSLPIETGKVLFVSNYIFMAISVIFFLLLYENLKFKNKFWKFITIFTLLFSYPFLFEYQRGNIVLLAVLLLHFFLFNYQSENKTNRTFALLSLSAAIALKPLPIFFLILLLFEKRFKDILIVLGTALAITLLSFLCLGGLDNIPLYLECVEKHQNHYKYVSNQFTNIFVFFALISFFFKENWKKCFAIVLLILICVPRGYNFLFLLPVIVMFLNKDSFSKTDILFGAMFILLISPIRLFPNVIYCYICEIIMIISLVFEKIQAIILSKVKNDN